VESELPNGRVFDGVCPLCQAPFAKRGRCPTEELWIAGFWQTKADRDCPPQVSVWAPLPISRADFYPRSQRKPNPNPMESPGARYTGGGA
jgi:hypothetical protein